MLGWLTLKQSTVVHLFIPFYPLLPPFSFEARTNLFSTAYVQGFDGLVYFEAHGEMDGSFRGYSVVTVARNKCRGKKCACVGV